MKAVQIDFVENKSRKIFWSAVALCIVVVGLVCFEKWSALYDEAQALQEATARATAELRTRQKPTLEKLSPRLPNELQVARALQADLNAPFTAIEGLTIAGVRLIAINLDTTSGLFGADFELETLEKVTQVTDWLNEGNEKHPWKLGNITASAPRSAPSTNPVFVTGMPITNPMGGLPANVNPNQLFKASWRVQIKDM